MATFDRIVSVANDGVIVQSLLRLCCKVIKKTKLSYRPLLTDGMKPFFRG